jgi:hypothetical protein
LLSQEKLLKVIDEDLKICRRAAEQLDRTDAPGKERNILEFNILMAHLGWAERAGTDQAELERVVRSLETNEFLRGYQRWRERSETKIRPEHSEPMKFPTSLRLEGGNLVENLYYCPVQGCTWRYAAAIGYKKATEF